MHDFKNLPLMKFYKGADRVEVARLDCDNFHGLVHRLRWLTPKWALAIGDRIGHSTIVRTSSPYKEEMNRFSTILGTGVFTLNTGYEWACTAMVRSSASGEPQLNRVLDWSLPMGEFMHVAHYETSVGAYYDINWPGNSGVLNAVAPGRFAISINQSPIPMRSKLGKIGFPFDWALQRLHTFRSSGWLPAHLLRHVFETAKDFDEAVKLLSQSGLAIPVIFTVCGTKDGERAIIERREHEAHIIRESGVCTANHWQRDGWHGHPRPIKSHDRLKSAKTSTEALFSEDKAWDWLIPPVFNKHSIMAFVGNTSGLLKVVNFKVKNGTIHPISFFDISMHEK